MANVSFDAVASSNGDGVLSLTYSHTCTGSNLYLVVGVQATNIASVTSITYNGVSMTFIDRQLNSGENDVLVEMWGLINPPTGAHNVVVVLPSLVNVASGSISFTNVNQSTPIGSSFKSTAYSVSVTGTSASSLVVDASVTEVTPFSGAGSGETSRYNKSTSTIGGAGGTKAAGGSVTMQWVGGTGAGAIVAFEIKSNDAATITNSGFFLRFLN